MQGLSKLSTYKGAPSLAAAGMQRYIGTGAFFSTLVDAVESATLVETAGKSGSCKDLFVRYVKAVNASRNLEELLPDGMVENFRWNKQLRCLGKLPR